MPVCGTNLVCAVAVAELTLILACLIIGWRAAQRRAVDGWPKGRFWSLIITMIVMLLVFSTRPVTLHSKYHVTGGRVDDLDLVKLELEKANHEIQFRMQVEDTWFHYKFLLAGTMLGGVFGVLQFQRNRRVSMVRVATSPTTCMFLSMACVVAVAIDIHLRNNIVVIQQLALWITHYAEPALRPDPVNGFKGWEEFLRISGAGMHADELYGLIFYPHLHLLTWVLYVIYLSCFQWNAVKRQRSASRSVTDLLLVGGFLLVHVALAGCAVVGHFVPGALVFKVLPFRDSWQTGPLAALCYCLLALLLVAINSAFLFRLVWPWRIGGKT